MNKMKFIAFFFACFISISGYGQGICYSISNTDQTLTISIEPTTTYNTSPSNSWVEGQFVLCWDASLGADVLVPMSQNAPSIFPYSYDEMDPPVLDAGRYYQIIGHTAPTPQNITTGVPIVVFEVDVAHGSIATGDFALDENSPIFGGTTSFNNIFGQQFMSGGCNLTALSVPLPVELISFSAKALDKSIQLKWQSETEENFSGYEIQRSTDKQTYKNINWVEGLGGLEPRTYKYVDNQISYNQDYYYRLKMIDTDGSYEYSPIRTASIQGDRDDVIVYPNPVRNIVHVDYTSSSSKTIDIQIINISGQIVSQRNVDIEKGGQIINLDIMSIPEGIYNVRMLDDQGIITKQIMKL